MIQVCLNGASDGLSLGEDAVVSAGAAAERYEDKDFRAIGLRGSFDPSSDESFFSALLATSKAAPGVLGVLLALPKLAKAPLPNPNAEDAPVLVGEATEAVVMLPMELNGFDLP